MWLTQAQVIGKLLPRRERVIIDIEIFVWEGCVRFIKGCSERGMDPFMVVVLLWVWHKSKEGMGGNSILNGTCDGFWKLLWYTVENWWWYAKVCNGFYEDFVDERYIIHQWNYHEIDRMSRLHWWIKVIRDYSFLFFVWLLIKRWLIAIDCQWCLYLIYETLIRAIIAEGRHFFLYQNSTWTDRKKKQQTYHSF